MTGRKKQPERQSFRLFRQFTREISKHRKTGVLQPALLVMLLAAAIVAFLYLPAGLTAHASRTESGDVTIEVVGEHSIDEEIIIEDSEVPLAMYSTVSSGNGLRHAVMMGAVLVCVIGYTLYFDRREKRLFELHREAALEQKRLMEENNN